MSFELGAPGLVGVQLHTMTVLFLRRVSRLNRDSWPYGVSRIVSAMVQLRPFLAQYIDFSPMAHMLAVILQPSLFEGVSHSDLSVYRGAALCSGHCDMVVKVTHHLRGPQMVLHACVPVLCCAVPQPVAAACSVQSLLSEPRRRRLWVIGALGDAPLVLQWATHCSAT